MSRKPQAIKNKQQKHPVSYFEQYLSNSREPSDDVSRDLPAELEAELIENNYFMRRRIKRSAQKMRNRYS